MGVPGDGGGFEEPQVFAAQQPLAVGQRQGDGVGVADAPFQGRVGCQLVCGVPVPVAEVGQGSDHAGVGYLVGLQEGHGNDAQRECRVVPGQGLDPVGGLFLLRRGPVLHPGEVVHCLEGQAAVIDGGPRRQRCGGAGGCRYVVRVRGGQPQGGRRCGFRCGR